MYIKKIEKPELLLSPPISQYLRCGYKILHKNEEVGEHITENREEILVILTGTATIHCEDETHSVNAMSVVYIPPQKKHNVLNTVDSLLTYLYIVTPVQG